MNSVNIKHVRVLGLSFLMFILISIISVTAAYGASESGTELKLDGTCVSGTVDNSTDYYHFTTPENGTVRLGVDNSSLELALYENASHSNRIDLDSKGYADLKAGTYYATVTGTGSYQIAANFSAATQYDEEPNDTMETAIPLVSGVQMKGNAYNVYEDVDWYKFEIKTKSYIYLTFNVKPSITIYNADGNIIGGQTKSGPMNFDNPGVYYIRIQSQNPAGYYDIKGDIVEYPTPNEITKAEYKGSRKVALTWSRSDYADGYYLFYKTSSTGAWHIITTINNPDVTSYTHSSGPSEGETYYYGVQAFRNDSVYGELQNQEDTEGFKVTAPMPAASNANLSIISGNSIQVSWSVTGKAAGYKIYRKANGGSYKLVKTVTSGSTLKWKDTGIKKGTNYVYKVVPYILSGSTKVPGKQAVTSSLKLTGKISAVTSVTAKKYTSYNKVSWKKNSLATGYKIYRKTGSGSYRLLKTITSTSYNDKSVKKGYKYTYKIKAYYNNYTYNSTTKKYTYKTVTSVYSKAVSVKR